MAKTVNYTPEQTKTLVEKYVEVRDESQEVRDARVKELAAMFGKRERSIRAKLTREVMPDGKPVYIAKTPVAKDGEPAVKKDVLAATLAAVSRVPLTSAESLTKPDLKGLIAAFIDRDRDIATLEMGDYTPAEHDENGDVSE